MGIGKMNHFRVLYETVGIVMLFLAMTTYITYHFCT